MTRGHLRLLMGLTGWPALTLAQTQVDLRTQSKNIDFSGASSTKTVEAGSALPGICAQSQLYLLLSSSTTPGQNLYVCTATNTWTLETGGSGGGGLSGLTGNALVTANGSNGVQTPDGSATLDSSGNLRTPGTVSAGVGGSTAGYVSLTQGTAPAQAALPANSFSLAANASISAQYQWVVPAADAAGAIVSNGAGTPGTLSIKAIQGGDANLLSSGSISGTGALLCTDASGGATTAGCPSGGGSGSATRTQTWWMSEGNNGNSGSQFSAINIGNSSGISQSANNNDVMAMNFASGATGYIAIPVDLSSWNGASTLTVALWASFFHPSATTYTFGVSTSCFSPTIGSTGTNSGLTPSYNSPNTVTFSIPSGQTTSWPAGRATANLTTTGCSAGSAMLMKIQRTDAVAPDGIGLAYVSLTGAF